MKNTPLQEAIAHRRSYYAISNSSPVSDTEIAAIIKFAVKHTPSAFNSQSARLVLLLGDNHKKLWNIVMEALQKIVSPQTFAATEEKINSFKAGYGTVLYFEDQSVIKSLQENFPMYTDTFPIWSQQSAGMHQFAVWTMLEDVGFGASLQHYNSLIEDTVKKEWALPQSWELTAQMPFGSAVSEPGEKIFQDLSERFLEFK